jgi:hypothetical protein
MVILIPISNRPLCSCKRVSLKLGLDVEEISSKLKDILGKDPSLVVKADSFHR